MFRGMLRRVFTPLAQPGLDRLEKRIADRLRRQDQRMMALSAQSDEILRLLHQRPRRASDEEEPSDSDSPSRPIHRPSEIAFPDEWIALALKDPEQVRTRLQRLACERFGEGARIGSNVSLTYPLERLVRVPHDEFFLEPAGALVASTTEELIGALRDFSLDVFVPHLGPHVGYDLAGYLRQTRIRVIAAIEEMRRRGMLHGRVLDVGSLYGAFALPLQRLGYQVTAVDRYRDYAGLEPIVERLQSAGTQVVATTRENEARTFDSLGEFDVVMSMAVIEHIPHTPRFFLEGLRARVKRGGLLVIDTPNLVKYWNRTALAAGRSVFMDVRSQYYAQIPFEGHHREYTGEELHWMLEQIGGSDIRVQYLESNLFQFEAIDRPHLECLLGIVQDPTQADTLLASGLF